MAGKLALVLGAVMLLVAGCVAAPEPYRSPLPAPGFAVSPLARPAVPRVYLPAIATKPNKFGLTQALAYRDCAYLAQFGASWHYDWSPYPLACPGSEAVPMLWAPGDGQQAPVPASRYLLVGNECDLLGQCNTSPEATAVWWREVEQAYPDRLLVGPNASHLGLDWLLRWHAAYIGLYGEPPRMWALGIHCYQPDLLCRDWVDINARLATDWTTSGKVWVTEWAMTACYYPQAAGAGNIADAQALSEADAFLHWLAANPAVERAAWFIVKLDNDPRCRTSLVEPDGSLSQFGKWYMQQIEESNHE